jgi:hypothetical protein
LRLSRIELGTSDLGVGINKGLLVDPSDTLHGADIERVLRSQIAGMDCFNLTAGLIVLSLLPTSRNLAVGQGRPRFSNVDLQSIQTLFEVGQVVLELDGLHAQKSPAVAQDKGKQPHLPEHAGLIGELSHECREVHVCLFSQSSFKPTFERARRPWANCSQKIG